MLSYLNLITVACAVSSEHFRRHRPKLCNAAHDQCPWALSLRWLFVAAMATLLTTCFHRRPYFHLPQQHWACAGAHAAGQRHPVRADRRPGEGGGPPDVPAAADRLLAALWEGIEAFDAHKTKTFDLRALLHNIMADSRGDACGACIRCRAAPPCTGSDRTFRSADIGTQGSLKRGEL